MEYITVIMSGLALLAAVLCLILLRREKKRNQKRNADLTNLIKAECNVVKGELILYFNGSMEKMEASNRIMFATVTDKQAEQTEKIEKLEKGIVPDYEEALAAKNSVDDFNRGLSAIMGYDPIEIARKAREEKMYGGEVK
jgi:hypothetical protein